MKRVVPIAFGVLGVAAAMALVFMVMRLHEGQRNDPKRLPPAHLAEVGHCLDMLGKVDSVRGGGHKPSSYVVHKVLGTKLVGDSLFKVYVSAVNPNVRVLPKDGPWEGVLVFEYQGEDTDFGRLWLLREVTETIWKD